MNDKPTTMFSFFLSLFFPFPTRSKGTRGFCRWSHGRKNVSLFLFVFISFEIGDAVFGKEKQKWERERMRDKAKMPKFPRQLRFRYAKLLIWLSIKMLIWAMVDEGSSYFFSDSFHQFSSNDEQEEEEYLRRPHEGRGGERKRFETRRHFHHHKITYRQLAS